MQALILLMTHTPNPNGPSNDEVSDVVSGLEAHKVTIDMVDYAAIDDSVLVCREDNLDSIVHKVTTAEQRSIQSMRSSLNCNNWRGL